VTGAAYCVLQLSPGLNLRLETFVYNTEAKERQQEAVVSVISSETEVRVSALKHESSACKLLLACFMQCHAKQNPTFVEQQIVFAENDAAVDSSIQGLLSKVY
jgi:hypothetical protein